MKRLILNMPIDNYTDVIMRNPELTKQLTPGKLVPNTMKAFARTYLGKSYSKMAAAAQRALEIPPFAELFVHEILRPEHISEGGCCFNRFELALSIAQKMNDIVINRPVWTDKTCAEVREYTDEEFEVMQHIIDVMINPNKEEYKKAWDKMVAELNPIE